MLLLILEVVVSEMRGNDAYAEFVSEMKRRTKSIALEVIKVVKHLPRDDVARVLGRQLLRSATSVGANYRAACRVRTIREFAAKLRIVCEESDETQYWIELLTESGILNRKPVQTLISESAELTAIFTKSLETTRKKLRRA